MRSRFCACNGGQQGPAATAADARRRPDRGGLPRSGRLRRESHAGRSAFPITCSCARRSTIVCTKRWTSTASSAILRALESGNDPHGSGRHARAVAVLPRDPQRQPVCLSRRRAARGTARPCGHFAAHAPDGRRRGRGDPRSRLRSPKSRNRLAPRARCRRAARRACNAGRRAAGSGMGRVVRGAGRTAPRHDASRKQPSLGLRGAAAVCRSGLSSVVARTADRRGRRRGAVRRARARRRRNRARLARIQRPDGGRRVRATARARRRGRARRTRPLGSRRASSARTLPRRRRGVVQSPRSRAHSPPDARACCGARSSRSARPSTCASCTAGNTSRRQSRLHGIDGTLHVVRQLEGYEIPAAAWEASILPARVAGYKREYLDRLCYSGEVMWGRLSPHPALEADAGNAERPRRIRPTKLAPIALFAREDSPRRRSCAGFAARGSALARRRAKCSQRSSGAAHRSLQRHRARHEPAAERSRGRRSGSWSRPAW